MTDTVSALTAQFRPGQLGAKASSELSMGEIQDFTLTQFTAWPNAIAQAGAEIAHQAGCSASPAPGLLTEGSQGWLLRVEPLRWWLVGKVPGVLPGDAAGQTHTVLDLSQSRVWLRLSGPSAAGFLNHHLPLDLRDSQFTQRRVACSAIHHVGVTLWRDLASFNLLIPRSFAVSIFQLLTDSACQYGVEIQSRDWTGKA